MHLPPSDVIITTEASMKGWEAVNQLLKTNGRWSQQESLQHINYLELKVAVFGLKSLSQRQVSRNFISAVTQHDRRCLDQQQRGYMFLQFLSLGLEMWEWCQARDRYRYQSHNQTRQLFLQVLETMPLAGDRHPEDWHSTACISWEL